MKTSTSDSPKLYEWHLAYRRGKSLFIIYCPQVKRAFAFVKNDALLSSQEAMLRLLKEQAHRHHNAGDNGESLFEWENYLNLAKIKCTFRLEL